MPPCGSAPHPAYPLLNASPNVETWSSSDLPSGWVPPSCISWASPSFATLVAITGVFRAKGGIDELLSRFGAITTLGGLSYWSVIDHRLQPLIVEAHAVESKSANRPRPNFTAAEMRSGKDLFFIEHDNRSSREVQYQMRVVEAAPDSLIVELDNVGSIRFMFFSVFAPGDLHSSFFLNRLEGNKWSYYSLSGAREGQFTALASHWQSHVNRSLAFYAHTVQTALMADLPWAK